MRIGINLVGVSYNNAITGGRLRNYEDAIENFFKYIIEPFRENGNEVQFYLYSYVIDNKLIHKLHQATNQLK